MPSPITIATGSPDETTAAAAAFAAALRGGEIVSLEGDLGAGKTFFARGVARALGVHEHVTSPTFVLQKRYRTTVGPLQWLVHYDLYRLGSYDELVEIGFDELDEQSVALVEWGDRFVADYPAAPIRVRLEYAGPSARLIVLDFVSDDQVTAFYAIVRK
jgi:tRNA threonylcarbamoyladenosine biosynthesis protein TsaE